MIFVYYKFFRIALSKRRAEKKRERCKGAHCVDLGESFQTHIFLQNLASMQPRTSPVKFARSSPWRLAWARPPFGRAEGSFGPLHPLGLKWFLSSVSLWELIEFIRRSSGFVFFDYDYIAHVRSTKLTKYTKLQIWSGTITNRVILCPISS